MYQIFLDWIQIPDSLFVSDDIKFLFVCISALFILSFILDFFRFILYYISRKD